MKTWRDKANKEIATACFAAWKAANIRKDGRLYRAHRPYTVPAIADALVDCLARDDEHEAKRIFNWGV